MKKYPLGVLSDRIIGSLLIALAIGILGSASGGCSHLPKIGVVTQLSDLRAEARSLYDDIATLNPSRSEVVMMQRHYDRLDLLLEQLKADPSPETFAFVADKIPDIWVPAREDVRIYFDIRCHIDTCTERVRSGWDRAINFADRAEAFYVKNLAAGSSRRERLIEYLDILKTVVKIGATILPLLDERSAMPNIPQPALPAQSCDILKPAVEDCA